jgi:hypothetical protein
MRNYAGAADEDIGAPETIRNKVCARDTIQDINVAIVNAARAKTKRATTTASRT